jgi:hypothetical protein
VLGTAKKQHSLGHRRFSSIDMSDDADVSQILEFTSHNKSATKSVIAWKINLALGNFNHPISA